MNYRTQTIIITGASAGIGAAFARELAQRGANLVLVARRRDRLDALAAELRAAHGVAVTPVALDLSSPTAAAELRAVVSREQVHPTALINNAGFGTFGHFVDDELELLQREIAVDISAPVQLSSEFLPDIIAARGFLINVASMAGYSATPRMAVYGAAKAFVLSWSESLWAELRGTGVTVFALSPGATSTEFNDVVGTEDATAGARKRTPENVVATGLAHLERRNPGPNVIDGPSNRASAALVRLVSRRASAGMMYRLTDPARRNRTA